MSRLTAYLHPKCSTCERARRWLQQRGVDFVEKDIRATAPSPAELRTMLAALGGKRGKLFNTSGQSYREGNWSERLKRVTQGEAIDALAEDGKLVKRPFILADGFALVGFDEITQRLEAERRRAEERLEKERQDAYEIEVATRVQARLFPQARPALPALDYAGTCLQARHVGGDYYDFLDLGPGKVGLVVGDISGKGIAAALLMAHLQASLRSQRTRGCGTAATLRSPAPVDRSAPTDRRARSPSRPPSGTIWTVRAWAWNCPRIPSPAGSLTRLRSPTRS